MGDNNVQNTNETTAEQMGAFTHYLPAYLQTLINEVPGFEQQMLGAESVLKPQQYALEESLFEHFGPRFAEIGTGIQTQAAMDQAAAETEIFRGPGGELLSEAQAAQIGIDPEYYRARVAAGLKLEDLIGAIDPTQLSGSERAETERSLNRFYEDRGINRVPSSTGAIEAGQTFGNRLQGKQMQVAQILSTVPQQLRGLQSGVDALSVAAGRPSFTPNPNWGAGQLSGTNAQAGNFGAMPLGIGQGFMGEIGQNARQAADASANKKDWADYMNQVTGSFNDVVGSVSMGF